MVKFLVGLIAGILLTFLVLAILVFSLARMREAPPDIAANSVLVLRLAGEIPERAPVELPFGLMGRSGTPTVANVWTLLRMAAVDKRIRAVVLEPQSLEVGWGKLEEIRADLERFTGSGKPLYAFLRTPGAREYYLALAANRIYVSPEDQVYLKGLRAESMYVKGTLDKLGIQVQVEHAGKYKDFGDMFTRAGMSPETREVLNSLLDDLYGNLVARIAAGRKKTPEEVRALIDKGPFLAQQARAAGLVDELRFEDQVFGELQRALKTGNLNKVGVARYMHVGPAAVGLTGPSRIALLVGEGTITRGDPGDTGMSEDGLTSEGFNKLLRRVADDRQIKGVIVRIDSPGGESTASAEIWREMNVLARKKPLVVSMSDTAASGGYYMAMTGDPIVAYPGTLTGSIGVVFGKPDLKGLYNKLGITKESVSRGRFADIDWDYGALDAAELAKLREGVEATYRDFVSKVSEARRRSYQEIDAVAQGRVWLGSQARARGLVDELGGLDRALEMVKQKAAIPAGEKVTVVAYPPRRSVLDVLFSRSAETVMESRVEKWVRARMRPGLLRIMPWAVEFR
ncbi:MAG: signal peptide peptidase SppA [Bryobacteraceae bacterium]